MFKHKILKAIGLITFISGMLVGIEHLLHPYLTTCWLQLSLKMHLVIFIGFGLVGFLCNAFSYRIDRYGSPKQNKSFWIGASVIFIGLLGLRIMGWWFLPLILFGLWLVIRGFYSTRKSDSGESVIDD